MDFRKAQGREIAFLDRIAKKGDAWHVSSRTRIGTKYKVIINNKQESCTCPDFATNARRCKHIHAVLYRTEYPQMDLVDPTPPPVVEKKKTYGQNWPNYNKAQTQEKPLFMQLLKGLCETVDDDEEQNQPGRPALPFSDLAFLAVYKVYERKSTRRFMPDAGTAFRSGYVSCEPCFNSIINVMNDPRLTQVLLDFIRITSLPTRPIERTFAADSSGFTSSKYDRWNDIKNAAMRQQHTWTKLHLISGINSHIVTGVVIKDKDASDTKQLSSLVSQTAENFDMIELYADKAYASIENYEMCFEYGLVPYIPFKPNHTGAGKGRSGKGHKSKGGELWGKMFHMFQLHREEFLAHYHQRSNVETVFSMIKAKFGGEVRSRTETAALNEVLCKVVCHNICCLISAMFEFNGVDLDHLFPSRPLTPNFQLIQGGLGDHLDRRPRM